MCNNDGADVEAAARSRGTAKASLQRYRQASAEIMSLLQAMVPTAKLERASIDEAYLDVTAAAKQVRWGRMQLPLHTRFHAQNSREIWRVPAAGGPRLCAVIDPWIDPFAQVLSLD